MATKQLPSLNGLRALSILIVIASHALVRDFSHGYSQLINFYLPRLWGQFGVDIFFIISGFLITLLLIAEEQSVGKISLKKFYLRRIFRIFPVYYFLLLAYFILQQLHILQFETNSWITSLTFTKYFTVRGGNDWESEHLWSLSIEENFYLLWPFIFKFLKPHRVKIAIVIILIVPIVRGYYDNGHGTIFQRGDALMMGCLLAIYKDQLSKWLDDRISERKWLLIMPFAGLICSLIVMKFLAEHINGENALLQSIVEALGRSAGTITNIFVCLIILISINFKNAWYDFLNTRAMNFIGKLSFSIYIWQQLFFSNSLSFLSKFPVNIIFIFIAATISYYIIEKPFLRLKTKFEVSRIPINQRLKNDQRS